MSKTILIKIVPLGFIAAVIIVLIFKREGEKREELLMNQETQKTYAIISKITRGTAVRSTPSVQYYYYIGKEKIEGHYNGDFNNMNIGDSILIEYSIHAPKVSRVFKNQ